MTRNWRYTSIKKLLLILAIPVFAWSCEEKIVVNLACDDPKIVIESYITNSDNPILVKITKSQDFFNQKDFIPVNKAAVQLQSQYITDKMVEGGAGYYIASMMKGMPGRSYSLKVTTGVECYEASVTLPFPVLIDTVYFRPAIFHPDSLNAVVEFRDPEKTENYYRIRLYYNGHYAVNDYFLLTDAFSDGMKIVAPVYYHNFAPGDTVIVELLNVEKCTWRYFKGLNESLRHGINSQSPGNPSTNITGGALGLFGAYGSDFWRVIIPKNAGGK